MCQYSAVDGFPTDWHSVHYGSLAVGGAGMVILEATAVRPDGRISWADLGIWDDDHGEALNKIAALISGAGAIPAIQLAHAGRKASESRPWDIAGWDREAGRTWPVISSTDRPFSDNSPIPRALEKSEIGEIIEAFASAAKRAVDAGFQVIEIHSAHGYLLHQFLSPLCNDRRDLYGGGYTGRVRIVKEIAAAVRKTVGDDVPVMTRISATDWKEGGWDTVESIRLADDLKKLGVDLVDCSSGGILPGISIPVGPGYQVSQARAIKAGAGISTGAVGMITSPVQADQIIRNGQADVVLLGREMLRDPYWPRRAARKLETVTGSPLQYARAW